VPPIPQGNIRVNKVTIDNLILKKAVSLLNVKRIFVDVVEKNEA
jgi:hypothetical protein